MPQNGGFLATFLALIGPFCTQKPVCFERFKKLSPLFSKRSLALFRQNSIFSPLLHDSLRPQGRFRNPFPRPHGSALLRQPR
jgi:hypothetical protein